MHYFSTSGPADDVRAHVAASGLPEDVKATLVRRIAGLSEAHVAAEIVDGEWVTRVTPDEEERLVGSRDEGEKEAPAAEAAEAGWATEVDPKF